MKIKLNTHADRSFEVEAWFTKDPDIFIECLRKQLKAATAVWPELKDFSVEKPLPRMNSGDFSLDELQRADAVIESLTKK